MYEDESPALVNGSYLPSMSQEAPSSSRYLDNGDTLHKRDLATGPIAELEERLAQLTDEELAEVGRSRSVGHYCRCIALLIRSILNKL